MLIEKNEINQKKFENILIMLTEFRDQYQILFDQNCLLQKEKNSISIKQ